MKVLSTRIPFLKEAKKTTRAAERGIHIAKAKEKLVKDDDQESSWQKTDEANRYWRTNTHPDEDDRADAAVMGWDLRCDACKLILTNIVTEANSHDEDAILDVMEGLPYWNKDRQEKLKTDVEPTLSEGPMKDAGTAGVDNAQKKRVALKSQGCNKHFRDLLFQKWTAFKCDNQRVNDTFQYWVREWCLWRDVEAPAEDFVYTYSVDNEGIYYACKNTIGKYSAEIAELISAQLQNVKEDAEHEHAIVNTCINAAKCNSVKDPTGKKEKYYKAQYPAPNDDEDEEPELQPGRDYDPNDRWAPVRKKDPTEVRR